MRNGWVEAVRQSRTPLQLREIACEFRDAAAELLSDKLKGESVRSTKRGKGEKRDEPRVGTEVASVVFFEAVSEVALGHGRQDFHRVLVEKRVRGGQLHTAHSW